MILRYKDYYKLNKTVPQIVHMTIITGTQIGINGKINWHFKWKRFPTTDIAYYRQLQERRPAAAGEGRWGIVFFPLSGSLESCVGLHYLIIQVQYVQLILLKHTGCVYKWKNTRFKMKDHYSWWTNFFVLFSGQP